MRATRLGNSIRRAMSVAALMSVVSVSLGVGMLEQADADVFTTPVGPPTLTPLAISDSTPSAFTGFMPGYPNSTDTYTVTTTVSKPGGITSDLNDQGGLQNGLTLCVYLDETDCLDSAVAEAVITDLPTNKNDFPDPELAFLMTWNWDKDMDTDVFEVVNSAQVNYVDDSSASNYTAQKDTDRVTSAQVQFSFMVSPAMRHSTDWNVAVVANDGVNTGVVEKLSNITTKYYGSVDVGNARGSMNFEVLESDSDVKTGSMGEYSANSNSQITYTATDFFNADDGTTLTIGETDSFITYSCSPTSSFDAASAVTFAGDSTEDFTTVGLSGEDLTNVGDHTCKVEYSPAIPNPERTFSNSVVIAIGLADENSPTNLTVSNETSTSADLSWGVPGVVSRGFATIESYVIEVSTDGTNFSFLDRITDGSTSYSASSLTERSQYFFRVTANTTQGSGTVNTNFTTQADAGASLTTLQALNDSMDNLESCNLPVSSIIAELESEGQLVFATPSYGTMAESMGGASGSGRLSAGQFDIDLFQSTEYLPVLGGFSGLNNDSNLNGKPYIGMVGFGGCNYLGTAFMAFHERANSSGNSIQSTADGNTRLRDLFRYDDGSKEFYGYVINANGLAVDASNNRMVTQWSNGLNPGTYGYNSTSKFASDDIVWGFNPNNANVLNGNGSVSTTLSNGTTTSYGIQNYQSGDSTSNYWWGLQYSGTNYTYFMFIGNPNP